MVSFFRGIFWLVVFVVFLAVVGRIFVFEVVQTNSYSMVPSLLPGDTFLVFTRGVLGPGESAVCHDPENPGAMIVSRVVGVPGSTVSLRGERLVVNGKEAPRSYHTAAMYEDAAGGDVQDYDVKLADEKFVGHRYTVGFVADVSHDNVHEYTVEDGFYLLGDNRHRARDSRSLGEIPIEDCIGTPFLIIWPGPDSGDFKQKNRFLQWLD